MQNTTCQICERGIKATTGVIAHHGYQRPWKEGWQSGSCFGARWRPYEVASDALPPAIARIKAFIVSQKNHYKTFTTTPPEKLTIFSHSRTRPNKEVNRPEGFTFEENESEHKRRPYESYEYEHHSVAYGIRKSIENAKEDLTRLEKRLADWKPQQN